MKKYLLILSLFCCVQLFAQEVEPPQENLIEEKGNLQVIETLKTAYITKELNLTSDEAQKFWPVYNEYAKEVKKIHIEFKDDVVALEEKKVVILKKYQENFKKILGNDDRVKKCFSAAPKFHQMLRKEWKRRVEMHRQNGGKQGFKPGNGRPPNGVKSPGQAPGPGPSGRH